MKQLIQRCGGWIACLLVSCSISAQNLSRIEYYFDTDPGYGRGTAITFTATANLANKTLDINPASLSEGVHFLFIRSRDVNGQWSFDNRWLFAKPYTAGTAAGTAPNITRIE